jgi:hypothetical protein
MQVLLLVMGEAYVFSLSSKGRLQGASASELLVLLMEKIDSIAVVDSQRTIVLCV